MFMQAEEIAAGSQEVAAALNGGRDSRASKPAKSKNPRLAPRAFCKVHSGGTF